MSFKDSWVSDDTFFIEVDYTGNTARLQIRLTFEGDQVAIQVNMEGSGEITRINGRLEE